MPAAAKTTLVFSGFNMRAVFAFIRTLEQHGLPYAVIASSGDDPIFSSSYAARVVAVRDSLSLDVESIQRVLAEATASIGAQAYLVAPSSEALNRFLLQNRRMLQSMRIDVPLVGPELYAQVSDKLAFTELCRQHHIAVPREYADITAVVLPFVAKPRSYRGWETGTAPKPLIVRNEEDLARLRGLPSLDDYYFQEYVEGASYYLLYYFYRDRRAPLMFSQENLVQQENGGSILAALGSDLHEDSIAVEFRKLFEDIGFTGLVMVELRGDRDNLRMIEANPRFWGPSQLFVDAGVNFFAAMLADHGFELDTASEPRLPSPVRYFWDDGCSLNQEHIDRTMFHRYSADALEHEYDDWARSNLFNRPDTLAIYRDYGTTSEPAKRSGLNRLRDLYGRTSKHSNYQVIAPLLEPLLPQDELETRSRFEKERFEFISGAVNLAGASVLDIGGNTGYFTLEAVRRGASVTYVEGNAAHAQFVTQAVDVLGLGDRVAVRNEYYGFADDPEGSCDVVFLLNVLHHVGDDYGDSKLSIAGARRSITDSLWQLAARTDKLVLQLGFNWKGDVSEPLFEGGTKREMIEFLRAGIAGSYHIERIGVAESEGGRVVYRDLDDSNIERRDELGEFLNRPIFILQSIR